MARERQDQQPAFSEAAPQDLGVAQIQIPGIRPSMESPDGNVITSGNIQQESIIGAISNEAGKNPWFMDVLTGNKKASIIVGAGAITIFVGYEILKHRGELETIREELQKHWNKDS